MNNKAIQILRAPNGIPNSITNDNENIKLLPGQPFYNEQKNYLTIGRTNEPGAPNSKITDMPITVRELNGWFDDNEGIKTKNDNDNDYYYIKPTNNKLEIKSPSDINIDANTSTFTGNICLSSVSQVENFASTGNTFNEANYGLNLNNSDIIGLNGLYFNFNLNDNLEDASDSPSEGIHFRSSVNNNGNPKVHSIICDGSGIFKYIPDRQVGTNDGTPVFTISNTGAIEGASLNVSGTSKLIGNVGIGVAPSDLYKLTVKGSTCLQDSNANAWLIVNDNGVAIKNINYENTDNFPTKLAQNSINGFQLKQGNYYIWKGFATVGGTFGNNPTPDQDAVAIMSSINANTDSQTSIRILTNLHNDTNTIRDNTLTFYW